MHQSDKCMLFFTVYFTLKIAAKTGQIQNKCGKYTDSKRKHASRFTLFPWITLIAVVITGTKQLLNMNCEVYLLHKQTPYKHHKHHLLYSQYAKNNYEEVDFLMKT